jgi:NAD(P)-dependent dehydrogenase (short-subunit alcohol dehydrogenase family)
VALTADLTDVASVEKLFSEVRSKYGHADVLVNNARTYSPGGSIADVNPTDEWTDFDVKVKGIFLVTQAFLKLLGTEKQGTIIIMSTGIAYMVGAGMSAYSIGKMASVLLAEYVAAEYPNVFP